MHPTGRYQDQPWYIRLWRRRHMFWVPGLYYHHLRYGMRHHDAWMLAKGATHGRMNWYYTMDEVRDMLGLGDKDDNDA